MYQYADQDYMGFLSIVRCYIPSVFLSTPDAIPSTINQKCTGMTEELDGKALSVADLAIL